MRLRPLTVAWLCVAAIAGVFVAQWVCASASCRSALGSLFGRGKLLALIHGSSIYEADVTRTIRALQDITFCDKSDRADQQIDEGEILSQLVTRVRIEDLARSERVARDAINREYDLVRFEIQPLKAWQAALHQNRLSPGWLKQKLTGDLRVQQWIERQIREEIQVSEEECTQYYEAHPENFSQPVRFRASHLFLAAPAATPPETAEEKRVALEAVSEKVLAGENFADLVPQLSDDESSKTRGGDLGFFSEWRMPSDFLEAVKNMRPGEISPVLRTSLGFHIVQLTDYRPGGAMSIDQCRAEIRLLLENQKRLDAVVGILAGVM